MRYNLVSLLCPTKGEPQSLNIKFKVTTETLIRSRSPQLNGDVDLDTIHPPCPLRDSKNPESMDFRKIRVTEESSA